MPIYEYLCQSCGHEMETLQKLSDAPLVECPACGAAALKKKLTAAAFRLKGSGWYETDFKHGKSGPPDQSKSGDKADGDAKDANAEKTKAKADKTQDGAGKSAEQGKSASKGADEGKSGKNAGSARETSGKSGAARKTATATEKPNSG